MPKASATVVASEARRRRERFMVPARGSSGRGGMLVRE
jgi:hypothetical protein